MIVSRPTIRTDNGKAALTLSNFNKLLGQLEVDFIDNVNIKEVHLGKKGVHLNKKGKKRLEMNFLQKLRNLWWSSEHLNETNDRQFDGISFSTLHELRKSNPFRVINGHININSIRNKSEPPKDILRHSFSLRN